jgi:hypothetical protein
MSDEEGSENRANNLIALTIAVLAAFVAVTSIKGSNVAQAMEQAQAERNNSWAWYQAVRVREDMATYELANLQRLERTSTDAAETARLQTAIAAQEEEIGRVRARKDEVQARAEGAEAEHAVLSGLDDEYDLSSALISIALALLAVCLLIRVRWLFWFSLLPALGGVAFGVAAMMRITLDVGAVASWLS